MPHQCSHGHAHGTVKADGWTNMSTVGEYTASFISDAYWMATLFDLCVGLESNIGGISYYGLGFGALVALLSAGGAAYSHRSLNLHHQQSAEADYDHHHQHHHHGHSHGRSHGHSHGHVHGEHAHKHHGDEHAQHDCAEKAEAETDVVLVDVELGHGAGKSKDELAVSLLGADRKAQLSWLQWLALSGDFVSHTGDIAGPITFVVGLATKASPLPRWGSALVQAGASLYGALSSVANVRSCKDAMLKSEPQRMQLH